jgi:hypothetical protein
MLGEAPMKTFFMRVFGSFVETPKSMGAPVA